VYLSNLFNESKQVSDDVERILVGHIIDEHYTLRKGTRREYYKNKG